MSFDLTSVLGQDVKSAAVTNAIKKYGMDKTQRSPPSGCYYISRKAGVTLFADEGKVVDIQINVQPSKPNSAFSGELPRGLKAGMTQAQVHKLLGKPTEKNEIQSHYRELDDGTKMVLEFDGESKLKYMSIAPAAR